MKALHSHLLLSPFLAAAFACGSLGDASERAPLAAVDGQLTVASTAPGTAAPTNVRVAVVWASLDSSSKYKTAQDIVATPVFPSKFHLELADPPPAEAMMSAAPVDNSSEPAPTVPRTGLGGEALTGLRPSNTGPGAGFAIATAAIVAYEDLNGNGKLDIVDDDASSYVDKVLGVNEKLLLVYIEGTAPAELTVNGTHPTPGYNLFKRVECSSNHRPGETTPPLPCEAEKSQWLPIATPYDLPLTAEPKFAAVMCKGGLFQPSNESSEDAPADKSGQALPAGPGPNGVWPQKDDPNLHCYSDNKGYYYSSCNTYSKGLCKGTSTECHATSWGYSTATPPAEWPCPAQ